MLQYADMYDGNTRVDYDAMKAAEIGVAYIRLGQSGLGVDKMFLTHRANLIRVGIPWGPYFLMDYRFSAQWNAANCHTYLTQVGEMGPRCPLMLDEEYEDRLGWGHPAPANMLALAVGFFTDLALLTGQDESGDLFYSNPFMFSPWAGMAGVEEITRHPLAVAEYGVSAPITGPWKSWTVWQSHGDVAVPWASQVVDTGQANESILAAPVTPPAPALDWQHSIDAWARTQGYNGTKP